MFLSLLRLHAGRKRGGFLVMTASWTQMLWMIEHSRRKRVLHASVLP